MTLHTQAVDTAKLRAQLAETATAIKNLKRELRTTWTRPMAGEQKTLCSLKTKATLLCVLRAYQRGRYHLQTPSARWHFDPDEASREDYNRQLAEHAADRYGLSRSASTKEGTPCPQS